MRSLPGSRSFWKQRNSHGGPVEAGNLLLGESWYVHAASINTRVFVNTERECGSPTDVSLR